MLRAGSVGRPASPSAAPAPCCCSPPGLVVGRPGAGVPPPAYRLAAHRADVPAAVLYAVALQERRRHAARAPDPLAVDAQRRRLATAIMPPAPRPAPGCTRRSPTRRPIASTPASAVNLGYPRIATTQPCELLDPYRNLAIAAEILREQHTPGEDWLLAIGRYHRPPVGTRGALPASVHRHLTRVLDPGVPVPTLRPPRHEPHRPIAAIGLLSTTTVFAQTASRAADRRRRPRR